MGKYDEFVTTYDDLLKLNPRVEKVITSGCWDWLSLNNKATVTKLGEDWKKNIRKNIKAGLWDKHGGIADSLLNFGFNKALIAVGAGPSFKKNGHILKEIMDSDGVRDWMERDFYIVASNHMYKPLLKMGIIPEFVILVDGSDVVYDQLCKNIPHIGKYTTLLAGVHCSPKVLKEWDRQGRAIKFFLNRSKEHPELFKKYTGLNAEKYAIIAGGNVLNSTWVIAMRFLGSTTFMVVGNDLCFPVGKNLKEQRAGYYADGDYTSNAKKTGTGRDEARSTKRWMGIDVIKERDIIAPVPNHNNYHISITVFGMPYQMWVYKTWIESQILIVEGNEKRPFHYFNCTEGGTLGVLNRNVDNIEENYKDINSWYLMDEVTPRYHTAMLKDAATWFKMAKLRMRIDNPVALSATGSGTLITPGNVAIPAMRR